MRAFKDDTVTRARSVTAVDGRTNSLFLTSSIQGSASCVDQALRTFLSRQGQEKRHRKPLGKTLNNALAFGRAALARNHRREVGRF